MTRTITRPTWLKIAPFALAAAFLQPNAASSGTVTVSDIAAGIAVDAQDAAIDEILADVGRSQGFDVERVGGALGAPITGHFTGALGEVMAKILRNQSHMIEHSASAKAGIARIVVWGAAEKPKTVTAPSPAPTAVAALAATPAPLPAAVAPGAIAAVPPVPTKPPVPSRSRM